MIKAFDNYEIWWVTGAQLLYGGDAVVAVDGHSKEMVAGLNDSGIIPIKVVYKGTANSSKEVEDVMKAANNDDKCVGISRSLCSISTHSITPRFPGRPWTWTS